MKHKRIVLSLLLIIAGLVGSVDAQPNGTGTIAEIEVVTSINPGSANYIVDAIEKATQQNYQALIIRLDTPGGLVSSTRDIVKSMLNANIPIIVYVSPDGARAGSAGVFITMASHIAVMAPSTNIGAAHPVGVGGGGKDGDNKDAEELQRKIENDTAAFIKAIAERRKRNVTWAVQAVRESVSITASEALKENVIDFIATDTKQLLTKIDGREVAIKSDTKVVLDTKNSSVVALQMSAKQKVVNAFADPNIAMILMTLGMLGILVEFYHPGTFIPGILGGISLILAMISFQMIPINYGGLLLVLLGLGLIIAELFVSASGIMGAFGGVAFLLGGFLLVDTTSPELVPGSMGFSVSPWVLVPSGIVIILAAFLLGYTISKLQKRKPATGKEALVGRVGETRTDVTGEEGRVFIFGEWWNAISENRETIATHTKVVVTAVDGMVITVKPYQNAVIEDNQ